MNSTKDNVLHAQEPSDGLAVLKRAVARLYRLLGTLIKAVPWRAAGKVTVALIGAFFTAIIWFIGAWLRQAFDELDKEEPQRPSSDVDAPYGERSSHELWDRRTMFDSNPDPLDPAPELDVYDKGSW